MANDLLDRGAFVNEVVDLAVRTPVEWTARIGIYGGWGEGKTSILNLVQQRLAAEHHVVARFNPWGFHDVDEMFSALADSVLEAIESQGQAIKHSAKTAEKVAKYVQKGSGVAADATKQASEFGIPGAGIVKASLATAEWATGTLRRIFEKKKIRALREAIEKLPSSARCAVLVDDVDRTDPALLPPLLFALHEVLTSIPISFIVALDPAIVGAALKEHHPGFGDGTKFLEKMIQFPRWLPQTSEAERWRIANQDVARYIPVLDREALRQEFSRFPRNPRELRTLLRGMWGLNREAQRYRPACSYRERNTFASR